MDQIIRKICEKNDCSCAEQLFTKYTTMNADMINEYDLDAGFIYYTLTDYNQVYLYHDDDYNIIDME